MTEDRIGSMTGGGWYEGELDDDALRQRDRAGAGPSAAIGGADTIDGDDLPFETLAPVRAWQSMTTLERAKNSCRGEGWTISGNRVAGYTVAQRGDVRSMTERELILFAGLD